MKLCYVFSKSLVNVLYFNNLKKKREKKKQTNSAHQEGPASNIFPQL